MRSEKIAKYLTDAGLKKGDVLSVENWEVLYKAFNAVQADALTAIRAQADLYEPLMPLPVEYEERGARRAACLLCLTRVNDVLEK